MDVLECTRKCVNEALEFHLHDKKFYITNYKIDQISEDENCSLYSAVAYYNRDGYDDAIRVLVQKKVGEQFDKKLFFAYFILLKEFEIKLKVIPNYISKCIFLKDNICVLENQHEKEFNIVNKWDLNHVKTVLKTLAQWHSLSLIIDQKTNQQKLYEDYEICLKNNESKNDQLLNALLSFKAILNRSELKEQFEHLKDNVEKYFKDVVNELNGIKNNTFKNVYCQGGVTLNNTIFNFDGTSCKFVDLQMIKYAPPMFDVIYLIYNNLTDVEIVENKNNLVKIYIEKLRTEMNNFGYNLDDIISNREFEKTAKIYTKLVKFMKVLYKIKNLNLSNYETLSMEQTNVMMSELKKLKHLLECDLLEYEELQNIIQIKTGENKFEINKVNFERLAFGNGFLGDHYFMKIDIIVQETVETLNFFVKLIPTDEILRKFVDNNNAFYKECLLFSILLPEIKSYGITLWDSFPQCFLARVDALVFEDLSIYGYKGLDKRKPLNLTCVKLCLSNMAKMHASGFVYEELRRKKVNKYERLSDIFPIEFHETLWIEKNTMFDYMRAATNGFCTMLKMFSDELKDIDVDDLKKWLLNYSDEIFKWAKPCTRYRNTICHGDLWHNNIMFEFDKENVVDCKFVDFQSYRYYPPGREFMSFLYWCTDTKFRSEHDVSEFYYEELKKYSMEYGVDLQNILSFDEFMKSVREAEPFCAIQGCCWAQMGKQTLEQLKETQEKYLDKFMYEDRSELVVKLCQEDAYYNEMMRNYILEFKRLYLQSLSK